MALVDMLLKVRDKYQLSIIIAHVNHNVRKESYEEAKFLEDYCNKNNLSSLRGFVRLETCSFKKSLFHEFGKLYVTLFLSL